MTLPPELVRAALHTAAVLSIPTGMVLAFALVAVVNNRRDRR